MGRAIRYYIKSNLSDWAAALTYYSFLSIFPAALVLVALLGLVGTFPETTDAILRIVGRLGPASAVETFRGPVESVMKNKGGASSLLGLGLLGALWSASAYVGAFMRASNFIYGVQDRRLLRNTPLRIFLTLILVFLLSVALVAVVLSGPLASAVGGVVGLSQLALTVWSFAKWLLLLVVIVTIVSVLYFAAPNVRQPDGLRWITVGAAVAVVAWIVASIAFGLYVANFGSYNKTYGSLGAVIVFLLWLYLSNNALLFGLLLNAERERQRELHQGLPADDRLYVTPRDPRTG
jgi:membrane protein